MGNLPGNDSYPTAERGTCADDLPESGTSVPQVALRGLIYQWLYK